jgi:hypothetical protein
VDPEAAVPSSDRTLSETHANSSCRWNETFAIERLSIAQDRTRLSVTAFRTENGDVRSIPRDSIPSSFS